MSLSDEYKTIKARSTGIFKDRGSKFIAIAEHVNSVDEANLFIEEIRKEYHDARHHCYAYKIGSGDDLWRINDDGEPSGSAGNPILGQIKSFELTNVAVVVTRWFGGTLLGVGGLINAYRTATREALNDAVIISRHIMDEYLVEFPYSEMNNVMKIIKEEDIGQKGQRFELDCSVIISIRQSESERIIGRLEFFEKIRCTPIEKGLMR